MKSQDLKDQLIDSMKSNLDRTIDEFLEEIHKDSDLFRKVVIEKSKVTQAKRDFRQQILVMIKC